MCEMFLQRQSPKKAGKEKLHFGLFLGLFLCSIITKNLILRNEVFSFVPSGTTSFAWHTQHHLTVRSTSLPLAAQMNEVVLRTNEVAPSRK